MSTIADHLRAQPYFEECSQATLDLLVNQAMKHHFEFGEAIFHEGDPALGLWLIEQGSVKIFKISLDGAEHILHLLGEGNTFNDIAAFDAGVNPANAAALSKTSACLISLASSGCGTGCRSGTGAARDSTSCPARAWTRPPF